MKFNIIIYFASVYKILYLKSKFYFFFCFLKTLDLIIYPIVVLIRRKGCVMKFSSCLFLSSALSTLTLNSVLAADANVTITGTKGPQYVATDDISGSGTSFDNFNITSNSAIFRQDLVGNQSMNLGNQTLSFSGTSKTQRDVIGLQRIKNGGNISKSNTINIKGGTIGGSVLATSDDSNYNGTARRDANIINISGGSIGGNVEGGAGAINNTITISGGTFTMSDSDDDCGDGGSGAIYAGVSDASTKNKSTNGTVILKSMNQSNSFLSSFAEGNNNVSGIIFGSNLTGTSDLRFEDVDDAYKGGFRDFDNVSFDANSNLTLSGKTYYADNWNVNGTLNTNGKTLHSYKNSTLNLKVGTTGVLSQQFLTDANILADNKGSINGINSNKNVNLTNSGKMTGNYSGSTVNITNSGTINASSGQTTQITSAAPGTLTNKGLIKENLTLFGSTTINNDTSGTINAKITNNQTTLNINNSGTIISSTLTNVGNKVINLVNNVGGIIRDALSLSGGILNLTNNGSLSGNPFTTNAGKFNIANNGMIDGTSSLTASNGGSFSFINNASGTVTGNLSIISGLNNFENNGSFNNLVLNNQQNNVTLNNKGNISGTGSILSTTAFNLQNLNGAQISGNQTWKNVNLNNANGALVQNLTLISDSGVTNINNNGNFSGSNSLNAQNGGSTNFVNNTDGTVTGSLSIISGLDNFENNGSFTNLAINNQQDVTLLNQNSGKILNSSFEANGANLDIKNSGLFNGTNNFTASNNGAISLTNLEDGKLSGQFFVNSGLEGIDNDGEISDFSLNSALSDFIINNKGTIAGNNNFTSASQITLNNEGESSGNLGLNGGTFIVNQNSSSALTNSFVGLSGQENLNINNANGSVVDAALGGNFNELTLVNNNTNINAPQMSLINSAQIGSQISVGNLGYTSLTNNNILSANLTDNLTTVADNQCLTTKFDLINNSSISGDISVKNNIFSLTNNSSGVITSEHIDSRDLILLNDGTFQNDSDYSFSIQNSFDINNRGTINGGKMVFRLTGDDVRGKIVNSGTIWSHGTTIGMGDNLIPCPDCGNNNPLELFNTGTLMAVDAQNFIIPDLNSYAINVPNMNVYNQAGGTIGGSLNVNNYTQESGATWVAFLDKDKSLMSTINVQNEIDIAQGSILYIHTNNDILNFTDGQTFQIVNAEGMSEDEVKTQLNNYTLKTDTPFATYEMTNDGSNGYIVFNKVEPTKYASATDLATSNHNNIISSSHRLYEMFVNRDMQSVASGRSSGDDDFSRTYVSIMPVGGHMRQKASDNHAGYSSDYYGSIGYIEHNFTPTFKAGVGISYLYSDADYSDKNSSSSTVDSYRPFAYINYEIGNWRFDVAGGWAKHKIKNNRKYDFDDKLYLAQSKHDADEISGHFSAGYRFVLDNDLVLQPKAGLFASKLKTDTYNERGSGPMNMHIASEDYTSFKSMIGLKIRKEYRWDNGFMFKPEMHLRWYHELGDTKGSVISYFLAQQELFNSSGSDAPKDIGDIALRLTTKRDETFDLFVEGFYQFGKDFYNVGGAVGLKYNF